MVFIQVQIISVCRGEEVYEDVFTGKFVFGDVIIIFQYGCVMICDVVFIIGICIVNESMFIGKGEELGNILECFYQCFVFIFNQYLYEVIQVELYFVLLYDRRDV